MCYFFKDLRGDLVAFYYLCRLGHRLIWGAQLKYSWAFCACFGLRGSQRFERLRYPVSSALKQLHLKKLLYSRCSPVFSQFNSGLLEGKASKAFAVMTLSLRMVIHS